MLPKSTTFWEQDKHILSGFSIESYPIIRLSFKENQFYFRTIRKLKIEKLSAIWISGQDGTQLRIGQQLERDEVQRSVFTQHKTFGQKLFYLSTWICHHCQEFIKECYLVVIWDVMLG